MSKFKEILARVLQVDEAKITDETTQDSIENWDSFNILLLASELEKAFLIKLTMEQTAMLTSVKAVKDTLAKCGVDLNA